MKTIRFIGSVLVLSVLTVMGACSAEDGQDGAIGPQGEQGPQGNPGEQGEQGETGTANVIYSDWFDSEFDNNIIATSSGFTLDAPDLTDEISNQGVVLVFGRNIPDIGSPDVIQLPFITNSNFYSFRIEEVEVLSINVASIDGGSVGTPFFDEFRYVIIPGGQRATGTGPGGLGTSKEVDYTLMTYEEIVEIFGIED